MITDRIITGAFAFACLFWGVALVISLIVDRKDWKDWVDKNCFGYVGAFVTAFVLLALGSLIVWTLIATGR